MPGIANKGYAEDLFAIKASVRNGCFRYPYKIEEVRALALPPSLLTKIDDDVSIAGRSNNNVLPAKRPSESRIDLHEHNESFVDQRDSGTSRPSSCPARENEGLVKIDKRTSRLFAKPQEPPAPGTTRIPRHEHPSSLPVIFVHFPTAFSLQVFMCYLREKRSLGNRSRGQNLDNAQSLNVGRSLSELFGYHETSDFELVSSAASEEDCLVLRFEDVFKAENQKRAFCDAKSIVVLFLDSAIPPEANHPAYGSNWEHMHTLAKRKLKLLCGDDKSLVEPTIYKIMLPSSNETRDYYIEAQLESLGVDLSAPVTDEMTQITEALSLLSYSSDRLPERNRSTSKLFNGMLDDQLISFIVFEIAASSKRVDSLEKIVELLSDYDPEGWKVVSDALSWLESAKPGTTSARTSSSFFSPRKQASSFLAEDPLGLEISRRVRLRLEDGTSLCVSLFFEEHSDGSGGNIVSLRETNLLTYAISRWIVMESPHRYLEEKTGSLDLFVKLLYAAGFSEESLGLLVSRCGDCLRTTMNRSSLARINFDRLYDMVDKVASPPLDSTDIIALTLRSDCDASGFAEGSCWSKFFLNSGPGEFQSSAISGRDHFGRIRLENIRALSSFADASLSLAREDVDHALPDELESALNKLERIVWLEMLVKDSYDFTEESDSLIYLAALECATWVTAENIKTSFECRKSDLVSKRAIDAVVASLSNPEINVPAYYFASMALWYYSGLQGGYHISRNALIKITATACEIMIQSQHPVEKASALRVLATVPFDTFSIASLNLNGLEKTVLDMLLFNFDSNACCSACALAVLVRIGSPVYSSACFIEGLLRSLSVQGHFNTLVISTMMFEIQLRAKYDTRLRTYSEGALMRHGNNDIAYMIDHGFANNYGLSRQDSERILEELNESGMSLFPTINLFLHYLQNENDVDKAFGFYANAASQLSPSREDISSACSWWGAMSKAGHPEGALVELLLESSGWPMRGVARRGLLPIIQDISLNEFKHFINGLIENNDDPLVCDTPEIIVERYYGKSVLDEVRALKIC